MPRCTLSALLGLLLLGGPARPESITLEFTVQAGDRDRQNEPVRVPVSVPAGLAKVTEAALADDQGKNHVGQLTAPGLLAPAGPAEPGKVRRELHFLLPALKAGAALRIRATLSDSTRPGADRTPSFTWADHGGEYRELRLGARPVLRYMHQAYDDSSKEKREQTYKVFHHLFDPAGERLVTKGPGGQYTHHRGLFFGFNKVTYGPGTKVDIWHCPGDTHQAHEKVLAEEAGPVLGRQLLEIAWRGKDREVFAREQRELTVYNVPGGTLVEFASQVRTASGPIQLDGDPQHAGFHFRADNEVSAKTSKQTIYVRPDGAGKPGETRNWPAQKDHVNLPWDAMSFVLGEKRYTAAYLDHPGNPKEARFSERDYGRFGSYFVYEITEDRPLRVNYRVWLQEGLLPPADVASRSAAFVSPVKVTQ